MDVLSDQSIKPIIAEHFCFSCDEVRRFAWARNETASNGWQFEVYCCLVCTREKKFSVSPRKGGQ